MHVSKIAIRFEIQKARKNAFAHIFHQLRH